MDKFYQLLLRLSFKFRFFRGIAKRLTNLCLLKGQPSCKFLKSLSYKLCQLFQWIINTIWHVVRGYWRPSDSHVLSAESFQYPPKNLQED
jgi:hypothetical protein